MSSNETDEFEINWNEVVARADRRAHLGKYMPLCPECRNEQVQLLDYIDGDAQWRCRICRHRFIYEPPKIQKV